MTLTGEFGSPLGSREVVCEQLIYTSAARTLKGSRGFGVVAHSIGWPAEWLDRDGPLTNLFDFLPQGATTLLDSLPPPHSLLRCRVEGRVVVGRKVHVGVDSTNRPGNYLVHLLYPVSGSLTALETLALWEGEYPLCSTPDTLEPSPHLSQLTLQLPPTPPPPPLLSSDEEGLRVLSEGIEGVLAIPRTGRRVVVEALHSQDGWGVLYRICATLPLGLTRDLTFSTYERDPDRMGLDLVVTLPQFQRTAPSSDTYFVALESPRSHLGERGEEERELAERLAAANLRGENPLSSSASTTVRGVLQEWRRLSTLSKSPALLTQEEITDLLLTTPSWVDMPGSWSVLSRLLTTPPPAGVLELLSALLVAVPHSESALVRAGMREYALSLGSTFMLSGTTEGTRVCIKLLESVGGDCRELERNVVVLAGEEAINDTLSGQHLSRLWKQIITHSDRLDSVAIRAILHHPQSTKLLAREWSLLAAFAVKETLLYPLKSPLEGVQKLGIRYPNEVVNTALELIPKYPESEVLGILLKTFPLQEVLERVLSTNSISIGAPLVALAQIPLDQRMQLLHSCWPLLATQAQIPKSVSDCLRPVEPFDPGMIPWFPELEHKSHRSFPFRR